MTDCTCLLHNGFLTVRGYEHAQQLSLEGLLPRGDGAIVDRSVSVSGLELERDFHVFDDAFIDEQYRRAYNGS